MSTLHEIKASPDGTVFRSIGPMDIFSQTKPKPNKNGEIFNRVACGDQFHHMSIVLKGAMAMREFIFPKDENDENLPIIGLTLTGIFVKSDWNGTQLNCDTLDKVKESKSFKENDVMGKKPHISIIEAMNAGLKAADYVIKKDRPELASAAFEVAARALLDGISVK